MNFIQYLAITLAAAILIVPDSSEAQGIRGGGRPISAEAAREIDNLANYVQKNQLQGCLARVICELSANSNALGQEGIKFGSHLLNMQRTTNPAASQYRAAYTAGAQSRNPASCSKRFSNCNMASPDIVRMGNNMLRSTSF